MMVGRSVSFKTEKQPAQPKERCSIDQDLVVNENRGVPAVKNLSLDVRAGEIVGIAGIDGNGQSELIQAITGLRKIESGNIELKGRSISGLHPRQITEMSVGSCSRRPSSRWFGFGHDDFRKHCSSNLL